jgi:hypothetical protein
MLFFEGIKIGNTAFWWLFKVTFLLLALVCTSLFIKKRQITGMWIITVYLLWNIFCIFRGVFIAETYWDFKGLIHTSLVLLVPIIAYIATNEQFIQIVFRSFMKVGLIIFVILLPILPSVAYGYYLIPITFFTLFLKAVPNQWKIFLISLTILVILIDLTARSNVIKFVVPIIFSLLFFFKGVLTIKLLNSIKNVLFVAPLVLFSLAATNHFNIFEFDKYIDSDYSAVSTTAEGNTKEENLLTDSRTFLYKEVIMSAAHYNSWFFGRSPARGNISDAFADADMNNRGERLTNEVAILNVFNWTGLVGVVLFALIYYRAAYLAINQSNSLFIKVLGLFIMFRWCYAWIEEFTNFDLNFILLWILIGICFSERFRKMNDAEFINWVRQVFSKKLIKI